MDHSTKSRPDVYQIITDQILELLESGTVPWHRPWRGGAQGMPKNGISKKPYRGINVFLLAMVGENKGYCSPWWLSYKQAKDLGGNVKKGEKSVPVVFWKWLERDTGETDKSGNPKIDKIPFLRYYRVFNTDQCENLNWDRLPELPKDDGEDLDFEPVEACERIVAHYRKCPPIYHDGGSKAFYRPTDDTVHVPDRIKFESVEEYYAVLFHELGHSTGHTSRLGRKEEDKSAAFGSADYGQEELVAEMSAAYLCGMCGIETAMIDNSAAYIDGWRKAIKGDKKLVVMAAAQAQKAVDHIIGE